MKFRFCMALSAGLMAVAPAMVSAQAWPTKPITIYVAYPAGGDVDAVARVFAEKLGTRLGQSVVVDNKPGASGVIGSNFVSKAKPDGYTLLMAPSTITMAQLVLKVTPGAGYDVTAFTPIFQAGTQPLFLAAGPGSKSKTLSETIAASKVQGGLAYGSPGSGSPMHVLGEMFNKAAGANFHHVPYRGVAPVLTDVAGGHVPLTWMTYGPVEPYLADGRMRLLAVAQEERSSLSPDTPTLAELGVKGVNVTAWNGLYGPNGLSPEIVKTLNTHLNEIIKMPDVQAKMKLLGILPTGGAPEVLAKSTAADLARFTREVNALGIKAD